MQQILIYIIMSQNQNTHTLAVPPRSINFDTEISYDNYFDNHEQIIGSTGNAAMLEEKQSSISPWIRSTRNSITAFRSKQLSANSLPHGRKKQDKRNSDFGYITLVHKVEVDHQPNQNDTKFKNHDKYQMQNKRPPLSEQYFKRKKLLEYRQENDFRERAQIKFKEIIKKTIQQKKNMSIKLNQTAKKVNLNLQCDAIYQFKVRPITKSLQSSSPSRSIQINSKNKHHSYRNKKFQFLSQLPLHNRKQSKLKNFSQPLSQASNRYDIMKTKQIFYKTLQLKLPSKDMVRRTEKFSFHKSYQFHGQKQEKRRATSQLDRKKSPKLNINFPLRPKIKNSLKIQNRSSSALQGQRQKQINCNVFGQGINFQSAKNDFSKTRRQKIREQLKRAEKMNRVLNQESSKI